MDQPAPSPEQLGPDPAAPRQRRLAWLAAGLWTMLVAASLAWNLYAQQAEVMEMARAQARMAFDKDLLYRRWSAGLGGVYAPVTPLTPPNPYLEVPERDLRTPGGQELTLINPAYMTRMVHEMAQQSHGVRGHITSLRPLRPANAPDAWEARSLRGFERGLAEDSQRLEIEGRPYLRLMRPLPYEQACASCHARQGYQPGQVRGGISVSVPLEPLLAVARHHHYLMVLTHGLLWLLGLVGLILAFRGLERRQRARRQAEQARDQTLAELRQALEQVQALSGLLPICASCKRIRDEQGQWQGLESYISQHSRASFSHGLCPICAQKLYPELWRQEPPETDPQPASPGPRRAKP
ncbi:MAG: DUF3365 domain-containing protein [Pseudomonadota bacterium]